MCRQARPFNDSANTYVNGVEAQYADDIVAKAPGDNCDDQSNCVPANGCSCIGVLLGGPGWCGNGLPHVLWLLPVWRLCILLRLPVGILGILRLPVGVLPIWVWVLPVGILRIRWILAWLSLPVGVLTAWIRHALLLALRSASLS